MVFIAIIIHLSEKYFLFCNQAWKHYVVYIISQTKCTTNIFVSQARKHSTQIVVTAIIKCLNEKYFLFRGQSWKSFIVYIISHKCTANIFVWCSGLKTFHGDYWLQQYILVVQVSHSWGKIFLGGAPTSICHFFHPFVRRSPYLRNYTSSVHNLWYTYVKWWYLQELFSFFKNFDVLGC